MVEELEGGGMGGRKEGGGKGGRGGEGRRGLEFSSP